MFVPTLPHPPKNTKTTFSGGICFRALVRYEREKSHESCALDGVGELALIFCSEASTLASKDTTVGIEKALEAIEILVVDELDAICVKVIVFHKGE